MTDRGEPACGRSAARIAGDVCLDAGEHPGSTLIRSLPRAGFSFSAAVIAAHRCWAVVDQKLGVFEIHFQMVVDKGEGQTPESFKDTFCR